MNKKIRKIGVMVMIGLSLITMVSCTSQQRSKHLGGNTTINLPAGQKLIMATWKDNNLWYLTEPAAPDYQPTQKIFQESSSWGMLEGTIVFNESK